MKELKFRIIFLSTVMTLSAFSCMESGTNSTMSPEDEEFHLKALKERAVWNKYREEYQEKEGKKPLLYTPPGEFE